MLNFISKKTKAHIHANEWHAIKTLVYVVIRVDGTSEEGVIPANSQGLPWGNGL